MFITFEGGEGCGKSTHARLLKEYLSGRGRSVVLTREPGGTELGRYLRGFLLRRGRLKSPFSELLLFAADRAEHVARTIAPSLKKGRIVICDRYIDSTTAYQIGGRRLPRAFVREVNRVSSAGIKPDLTILLDVDPAEGIRRGTRHTGKDRFESENMAFHRRIRAAYLAIARKDPRRVKVISSSEPMGDVQDTIRRLVNEKL